MRERIAIIFLFLLVIAFDVRAEDRTEVVIGVTSSMSGNLSYYGQGFVDAVSLAVEEVNKSEQGNYGFRVIYEDNQSSAAQAVSTVRKLTDVQHANVIFSAHSHIAVALAPIIQRQDLIHFGVAPDSSYADGTHNFNFWPAPIIPATVLVEELEKQGIKSIGLVGVEHAYSRAILPPVKKLAKAQGIEVNLEEYFLSGENNFRPILHRIASRKPDMVVLAAFSPDLELFRRQQLELNIDIPLTTDYSFESTSEKDLFEGYWFVSIADPDPGYVGRFQSKFGYEPYAQMEIGDLMVKVLAAAYKKAGKNDKVGEPADREDLARILNSLEGFQSIYGPISFDQDGSLIVDYVVKEIRDGQVKLKK